MQIKLGFTLDVDDDQDPAELRDRLAAELGKRKGVRRVVNRTAGRLERDFLLVGVTKGKPDQRWQRRVKGASEEEAEAEALKEDPMRVIAAVIAAD